MNKILPLLLLMLYCTNPNPSVYEQISAEKLQQLKEQGVMVVDVRTAAEYAEGHIPGAVNIDYLQPDFIERMKSLDTKQRLIIHCASGGRSKKAANDLQNAGFLKVYEYSGGFNDWKSKNLEIEK